MGKQASPFRYGFKTEASGLASEVRQELGLTSLERLDPWQLAGHLEIPVVALSDLAGDHAAIRHLLNVEPEAFSAATVFCGVQRTIVHNDGHSLQRQHSNLTHELAHGLLMHPPKPALDTLGCRDWDPAIEAEADWLAGELLVTKEAAMQVALGKWTEQGAALKLGVSTDMIRFRVNMTGARKIVQRAAARKAG